jgi:Domain of unknown function (DUF4129)
VRPFRKQTLLGVGLLAALSVSSPSAGQSILTPQQFSARLERAIDVTKLGSAVPSEAWMRKVREAVGLPVMVRFYGRVVTVPQDRFLEDLSGKEALDFDRAAVHLGWQYRQLQVGIDLGTPDVQGVGDALDQAYRQIVHIRPNLLERIRRGVADLIGAFVHRLVVFAGPGSLLAWAFLLALVASAVFLLRRVRLFPDRILIAPAAAHRAESIDWSHLAEEALRAGDLKRAVRALYMALVATMARRGLLVDAPALTAGECRAVVQRTRPGLYPELARATEAYERVIYGSAAPSQIEVDALREANVLARTA